MFFPRSLVRYETFFDCDLAWFLLERAVQSQRVGHFFFWYLKAEMHQPDVRVRYGLLLEAYCRGCSGHMLELEKQVSAMDALVHMANSIKPKDIKKKDKCKSIQKQLAVSGLGEFQLPYQPAVRLGKAECPRVMDSKKLPLWLDFDNVDGKELGKEMVIFKVGDAFFDAISSPSARSRRGHFRCVFHSSWNLASSSLLAGVVAAPRVVRVRAS
jgi:phosphatidylinositol-4,5-bisphosphate 3-kinase